MPVPPVTPDIVSESTPGVASEPNPPAVDDPHPTESTIQPVTPPQVTQDRTDSSPSPSDPGPSLVVEPSTFLSGDSLQGAINNIVDMGFPRDQVLRAMRASFNNADRAVEYLTTVSDFTTFLECFNLIYYFSRGSQNMLRLMLLRQPSALRFSLRLRQPHHRPRISLKIYFRSILSFLPTLFFLTHIIESIVGAATATSWCFWSWGPA